MCTPACFSKKRFDCRLPRRDSSAVVREKRRYEHIVGHRYNGFKLFGGGESKVVNAANARNRDYARLRALEKSAAGIDRVFYESVRKRIDKLKEQADTFHCLRLVEIEKAKRMLPSEILRSSDSIF